jgi:hypothetical protein
LLSLARAGKHIQITSPFLSSCLLWQCWILVFFFFFSSWRH